MSIVTHKDFSTDYTKLSEVNRVAMIQRGFNHYFGNEQAAKVSGFKNKNPNATEAEIAEFAAAARAKAIDTLLNGEVGVGSRGPSVDPVEVEVERVAKATLRETFAKRGLKFPKDGETINVAGTDYTSDELVDKWIAKNDADGSVTKAATKTVKAKAKLAAERKAAKEASGNAPLSAEDLGF